MVYSKKRYLKNMRFTYKALNIFLPDSPFQSLPQTDRIIYLKINSSKTVGPSYIIIAFSYSHKTNNPSRFNFTPLFQKNECVGTDAGVSTKENLLVRTLKKK
jgi:hypothetical protein